MLSLIFTILLSSNIFASVYGESQSHKFYNFVGHELNLLVVDGGNISINFTNYILTMLQPHTDLYIITHGSSRVIVTIDRNGMARLARGLPAEIRNKVSVSNQTVTFSDVTSKFAYFELQIRHSGSKIVNVGSFSIIDQEDDVTEVIPISDAPVIKKGFLESLFTTKNSRKFLLIGGIGVVSLIIFIVGMTVFIKIKGKGKKKSVV